MTSYVWTLWGDTNLEFSEFPYLSDNNEQLLLLDTTSDKHIPTADTVNMERMFGLFNCIESWKNFLKAGDKVEMYLVDHQY